MPHMASALLLKDDARAVAVHRQERARAHARDLMGVPAARDDHVRAAVREQAAEGADGDEMVLAIERRPLGDDVVAGERASRVARQEDWPAEVERQRGPERVVAD